MGSLCSSQVEPKEHRCDISCFGNTDQINCQWFPSTPFKWEYTNEHQLALKSALNQDEDLEDIGQDVIIYFVINAFPNQPILKYLSLKLQNV